MGYMLGKDIAVVSTSTGKKFASKLISELEKLIEKEQFNGNTSIHAESHTEKFANTELLTSIDDTVRGKHVYVVADCENHYGGKSTNDNLVELIQMISAAHRSSAERITVLVPSPPYARQDIPRGRQPITASIVAKILEEVAEPLVREVITFDVHNRAMAGFYRKATLINLFASRVFIPYIQENFDMEKLLIYSPDLGGVKRAHLYADELKCGFGAVYKERDYTQPNESYVVGLFGMDVKDKDVILIDDMFDTGSTMINAVNSIKEKGARNVYIMITHPMFNIKYKPNGEIKHDPVDEMQKLYDEKKLSGVFASDTVNNGRVELNEKEWYTEISVAPLAAKAIYNIHTGKSISSLLE